MKYRIKRASRPAPEGTNYFIIEYKDFFLWNFYDVILTKKLEEVISKIAEDTGQEKFTVIWELGIVNHGHKK
jgi:hypothetical protein